MRNILIICAVLFSIIMGTTSCDQEAALEPTSSSEVVELGSFEQLESLLFDLALEAQENQMATIFLNAEKGFYAELSEVVPGALQARKPRCKGTDLSFVKCVKKAIEDSGCQQITSTESGEYESNDC